MLIKDPHIKLLTAPLRVIKFSGPMTIYKDDDSYFESLLTSMNGDIFVGSNIKFEGNHAENAVWKLFNLEKLNRKDRLEIKSFKIIQMNVLLNNLDMREYEKVLSHKTSFLDKGIKL